MTVKCIKSIQGHYGAAVRSNDTLPSMKSAIWAIFNHRNGDHSTCPEWCAIHDGDTDKANKNRLPKFVCDLMRPVFERLASDDLLEKCLHGGTQNANEAFHHTLWAKCPKEKFAGRSRIQLAASIATLTFNDGEASLVPAFKLWLYLPTARPIEFAKKADNKRVEDSLKAVGAKQMNSRQRKQWKKSSDSSNYLAGGFYTLHDIVLFSSNF